MSKPSRKEKLAELKIMREYITNVVAAGVARALPGLSTNVLVALDKKCEDMEVTIMDILDKP